MKKLLILPWLFLTGIPLALFGGLVVSNYWSWFISPTFSVDPITYLQAVGLMLFVSLFKIGLKREDVEKNDTPIFTAFATQAVWGFVWLVAWGVGAVWSLFI